MAINEDTLITTIEKLVDKADTKEIKNFNVQKMAEKYGIDENKLTKDYKQKRGLQISDMFKEFKLQKALNLVLKRPELLIKEIAIEVGYDDSEYFSKIFRIRFGSTPSELRRDIDG